MHFVLVLFVLISEVQGMARLLILDWTRMLQASTASDTSTDPSADQTLDSNNTSSEVSNNTDNTINSVGDKDLQNTNVNLNINEVIDTEVANIKPVLKQRAAKKTTKSKKKEDKTVKTYPSRVKSTAPPSANLVHDSRTHVIEFDDKVMVSIPSPLALVQILKVTGKGVNQRRGRKRKVVNASNDSGDSERSESPIKPPLKLTIKNGNKVLAEVVNSREIKDVPKAVVQNKALTPELLATNDGQGTEADDNVFVDKPDVQKNKKKNATIKIKKEEDNSDDDFVVQFKPKDIKKSKKSGIIKPVKKKFRSIIIASDDDSDDDLPDIDLTTSKKIKIESKESNSAPIEIKLKEVRKDSLKKLDRSESVSSDSSEKKKSSNSSDKTKSSSDKYRNDKSRDRESDKKRDRDKDRKSSSSNSSDKDRKSSSSSKDKYKDKNREKDRHSKDSDRRKDRKELTDKEKTMLNMFKPLNTESMAKIPKKPASFLDALGSADVGSSGESQIKKPPIKMKSHSFRSTGLMDGAQPTGPGIAGKRSNSSSNSSSSSSKSYDKYGLKKEDSAKRPLEEPTSTSTGDKRFKSTISSVPMSGDRPGGIKLISPKRRKFLRIFAVVVTQCFISYSWMYGCVYVRMIKSLFK